MGLSAQGRPPPALMQQLQGGSGSAAAPGDGNGAAAWSEEPPAPSATVSFTPGPTPKEMREQQRAQSFKGEGSVHKSESSGASSVRKSALRLRRLLSAQEQPLLQGLYLLRLLGVLMSLLAIVLAAALAVQTMASFQNYNKNLVYTLNSAMRITTSFNTLQCLEALVLNAKGYLPMQPAEEAAMRAALVANATQYQLLQNQAFAYFQTTARGKLYTDPFINVIVYDSAKGGPDGVSIFTNLVDASDMFVAKCSTAANLTNSDLADDENAVVKYLLVNWVSGGKAHEAMVRGSAVRAPAAWALAALPLPTVHPRALPPSHTPHARTHTRHTKHCPQSPLLSTERWAVALTSPWKPPRRCRTGRIMFSMP
jgi:hypothetical protein